jgi:hypothetical protein
MQIKLYKVATRRLIGSWKKPEYAGHSQNEIDYIQTMMKLEGQTLEVDTRYLFSESFNAVKPDNSGLISIPDCIVESVINDERLEKGPKPKRHTDKRTKYFGAWKVEFLGNLINLSRSTGKKTGYGIIQPDEFIESENLVKYSGDIPPKYVQEQIRRYIKQRGFY